MTWRIACLATVCMGMGCLALCAKGLIRLRICIDQIEDYIGAGLFFLTRISRIGRIGLADSLASDDKICRR